MNGNGVPLFSFLSCIFFHVWMSCHDVFCAMIREIRETTHETLRHRSSVPQIATPLLTQPPQPLVVANHPSDFIEAANTPVIPASHSLPKSPADPPIHQARAPAPAPSSCSQWLIHRRYGVHKSNPLPLNPPRTAPVFPPASLAALLLVRGVGCQRSLRVPFHDFESWRLRFLVIPPRGLAEGDMVS